MCWATALCNQRTKKNVNVNVNLPTLDAVCFAALVSRRHRPAICIFVTSRSAVSRSMLYLRARIRECKSVCHNRLLSRKLNRIIENKVTSANSCGRPLRTSNGVVLDFCGQVYPPPTDLTRAPNNYSALGPKQ